MSETLSQIVKRMCRSGECKTCPIHHSSETEEYCNIGAMFKRADDLEGDIVAARQWASENPLKTYKSEFLKEHPNAKLFADSSAIMICRKAVYGGFDGYCDDFANDLCEECWDQPIKEDGA